MTRLVASTLALIVTIAVSVPPTRAQQSEVTAEEVVAALRAIEERTGVDAFTVREV